MPNAEIRRLLDVISANRLQDEKILVTELLEEARNIRPFHIEAMPVAREYIENFRNNTGDIALEEFFRYYGLDTNEGVAVMCLAEALLRIPDNYTANEFIHDKLAKLEWKENKNINAAPMVKASSFGLKIAGKLFELGKTISTVVDPVVRESIKQSMRFIGDHFVMGETIDEALVKGLEYRETGYTISFDMLGEGARSEAQAKKYLASYLDAVQKISASLDTTINLQQRRGISVKLSALYSKYKLTNKEQVMAILLPRLVEIVLSAKSVGIPVTIDAEEMSRLDLSLELFIRLLENPALAHFDGIGLAVQAYGKSAPDVINLINMLGKQYKRIIPVRLVKGAYWDSEIKAAQVAGISEYPVFTRKEYTDLSYLVCAQRMLEASNIYPQFATHNALTIAMVQAMAGNKGYEFQKLYGMGNGIYGQIVGGKTCRIYAPVGHYNELLPYLIRRILENGASTSFLKKAIDETFTVDELVKDTFAEVSEALSQGNVKLSLPQQIYGTRQNSPGFDLGNQLHLNQITAGVEKFLHKNWHAAPVIEGYKSKGRTNEILAPYNNTLRVGTVTQSSEADISDAIEACAKGFIPWSQTTVGIRAEILEQAATLLEKKYFEAVSLLLMEAGKNIPDAIAEVREAIDFCRYYAEQARKVFMPQKMHGPTGEENLLSLHGRGVFVCISPWNFPLAIFTGQVAAALVAGNTVIAKPAEQTPLVAAFMVDIFLEAGLPQSAISLLPGDGPGIGNKLLADGRVAGVVFTGSFETAGKIQASLAGRGGAIIPFIAETGGLNAMIVDSSALIEQAVDDIVNSAFGSAGQRCSALRMLYVQEDIADELITLLQGAMANLAIGIPTQATTDIGPVIDSDALQGLSGYIAGAKEKFKVIAEVEMDGGLVKSNHSLPFGNFVAPVAFEVASINDIPTEIFGPVLHIARYKANNLDGVMREINSRHYGLTFGIQSRVKSRVNYIRAVVNAGNIYVNRSMIGATVGVHPFGGEGLSGTGPKAGGPHYLRMFATERTFTDNIVAIGGNRELLI